MNSTKKGEKYAYNNLPYSTASKNRFALMFKRSIRELMTDELVESILQNEVDNTSDLMEHVVNLNCDPRLDILNAIHIPSLLPEYIAEE